MKKLFRTLFAAALCCLTFKATDACTNFIITRGASSDGSVMVSYAADSHQLYGALYKTFAGRYKPGTMLPVYDWDSGRYLGEIPQAAQTYATIGNMNEHSLIIAESTYGGREELADSTGRIDYGSLIYITLQRAKTAREAIRIIVDLANTYGYASSGESFSIADQNEAWIMELIGKGCELDAEGNNTRKGIVWVARRIPDGYVSAHANQSRITTFPLDDPENCLYAPDVISFAREKGYFNGPDEEFSFCDAYAPADFGTVRGCDARVWAFFRTVADDMDQYTDYAMGYNMSNRMPLWVKPRTKVDPKTVFDAMRDHYLIHLVVSGKGIFEVGGRTWEVSEGDLFFARPSQLIRYTADEQQPWEYSWVGFNGACAHKLAAQLPFTDDAPVHHTSDPDGMRAALNNIYSSRGLQPQDEAAMVGYLYLFIAALMRETSAGKPHTASSSSQYVLNAIKYIQFNYSHDISIDDVAKSVGVSRSHLYRVFMLNVGKSPIDYLTEYRINEACKLLRAGNLSIAEVAVSVGFFDQFYFSRVFKRAKGVPPSKYFAAQQDADPASPAQL